MQRKQGIFSNIQDEFLKSNVFQIKSKNVVPCFMSTPKNVKCSLGIKLPFFTMLVTHMGLFFSFEVTVSGYIIMVE